MQDTKYDTPTTVGVYNAWKAQPTWSNVAGIFIQGTPMVNALAPLSVADGKIIQSGSFDGSFGSPTAITQNVTIPSLNDSFAPASLVESKQSVGFPSVFFQGTDYSTGARIAMNYVWTVGSKRVGFFYCSTSAFCTDPVDGAKTFLSLLGGTQIGRNLSVELADDDATIQTKVLAFFTKEQQQKQADPTYTIVDWVWAGNTAATTISIIKALQAVKTQLGLTVSVIANNWGFNESVFSTCGAACVGAVVEQPFPIFGDITVGGMPNLLTTYQKYRQIDNDDPSLYKVVQYVYGYVAAAAWQAAMEQVVDRGLPVNSASLQQVMKASRTKTSRGSARSPTRPRTIVPSPPGDCIRWGRRGRSKPSANQSRSRSQSGWLGW